MVTEAILEHLGFTVFVAAGGNEAVSAFFKPINKLFKIWTYRSLLVFPQRLALPLVLGIMRAHHGAVTVASKVGEGTIIKVCCPVFDGKVLLQGIVSPNQRNFSSTRKSIGNYKLKAARIASRSI